MTDTPPLTAAKVRAILRKAGYSCARSHTTRIRGWHSWSPGYRVTGQGGDILVEHMADYHDRERRERNLQQYLDALTAAGMVAFRNEYEQVTVRTAKTET